MGAADLWAQGLTGFLSVLVAESSLFTSQDRPAQSQRVSRLTWLCFKSDRRGMEVATGLRRSSE